MQKSKLLVAVLGALCAMPVMAADAPASPHTVTSNVGFTSNYVFRGISQNAMAPAIQGGMDYAHKGGFYAGAWGSNVSWIADSGAVNKGSVTMELDTYFGYKNSITDDVGYDAGFIRYNYLGNYTPAATSAGYPNAYYAKADTAEVYAAISYKFLTAKYSYSVMNGFLTVPDSRGTSYLELNASYTIPDTTYTLIAHVGKQEYMGAFAQYEKDANNKSPSYTDIKVGVSKDFSGYIATVAYTNTNASQFYTWDEKGGDWGRGMTAVSLTHAF